MKIDDLYYQNVQSATGYASVNANRAAAADKVAEEQSKDAVKGVDNNKTNTDRVEFSKDTRVTNKMSDSERAALVQSLKADLDNQMARFTNMMTQMFQKQGISANLSQGNDFWRFMASGVKQTSQRIFDFAYALAGDDPEKMKKMQAAVEKGFEQATKSWGGKLPSITDETHSAIGDLFDSYYEKAGKAE